MFLRSVPEAFGIKPSELDLVSRFICPDFFHLFHLVRFLGKWDSKCLLANQILYPGASLRIELSLRATIWLKVYSKTEARPCSIMIDHVHRTNGSILICHVFVEFIVQKVESEVTTFGTPLVLLGCKIGRLLARSIHEICSGFVVLGTALIISSPFLGTRTGAWMPIELVINTVEVKESAEPCLGFCLVVAIKLTRPKRRQ